MPSPPKPTTTPSPYPCRYGFKGFYDPKYRPIVLTKAGVENINLEGGTILGTSRQSADIRWGPARRGGAGLGCTLPLP